MLSELGVDLLRRAGGRVPQRGGEAGDLGPVVARTACQAASTNAAEISVP